jgi:hypothetical protein
VALLSVASFLAPELLTASFLAPELLTLESSSLFLLRLLSTGGGFGFTFIFAFVMASSLTSHDSFSLKSLKCLYFSTLGIDPLS